MILTIALLSAPIDFSAPPIYLFSLVASCISLARVAGILLVPMSRDQRGILGFMTFVFSFPLFVASLGGYSS
jgi:hypothetical protein